MSTNEVMLNPGFGPGRKTVVLYNRCGATVKKGEVVAVNANGGAVAGQNMTGIDPSKADVDGPTGYWASNGINPTTANRNYYLALALKDVPDNGVADFLVEGEGDVLVPDGAAMGDFIIGTNGSRVVTILTLAGVSTLVSAVGICGHVLVPNSSGVTDLRRCVFKGDEIWTRLIGV